MRRGALQIDNVHRHAKLVVHHQRRRAVAKIEAARHIRQKNNLEAQPLALMDAHNAHAAVVFAEPDARRRRIHAAGFEGFYIMQESRQAVAMFALVFGDRVDKCEHILLPLGTVVHAQQKCAVAALLNDLQRHLSQRRIAQRSAPVCKVLVKTQRACAR